MHHVIDYMMNIIDYVVAPVSQSLERRALINQLLSVNNPLYGVEEFLLSLLIY